MTSRIKPNGRVGDLLNRLADCGGMVEADCLYHPPSHIFAAAHKRGFVARSRSRRVARLGIPGRNRWTLTAKGWAAIGRTPPA